jgi:hypothetical protein
MECEVCGNELPPIAVRCPYCGAEVEARAAPKRLSFCHKTVNLEAGRPVVEVALRRLEQAVDDGLRHGVTVITLIHGYGSSGKGGAIREECRKMLEFLKGRKVIGDYLCGEDFVRKSARVRALLQRYPDLARHNNLGKGNPGITLVVLS